METGGGRGNDPDNLDLIHLSGRVRVLEETVLKLTSAIEQILQKKEENWTLGKDSDGEKEEDDLDHDLGGGDKDISKGRTRRRKNSELVKGHAAVKEDVDVGKCDDLDLLENLELVPLQYDPVLIDMKSEPFEPIDSQEDEDLGPGLNKDIDDNSENNYEDSSHPLVGSEDVCVSGTRLRRTNRTTTRPIAKSNHISPQNVSDMDQANNDDSDYHPSEEDDEDDLDPPPDSKKKAKKMIKIISSSKSESTLPNPYISLGPKIKKTKTPPPPKGKKSKLYKNNKRFRAKRHYCTDCDYITPDKRKLVEHTRKHTGERPWLCETCGQGFRGKWLLSSHMRTHDLSKPPRPSYKCDLCGLEFKLRVVLRGHVNRVHKDQRRQCDLCKGIFANIISLRSHKIKVHGEKNAFICEHCGHGFAMATHLKLHVARHSDPGAKFRGPKKYPIVIPPSDEALDLNKVYVVPPGKSSCEVEGCGKTFGNKILLDYHTRMDHMTEEERKVKCHICHGVYKDINAFKSHMKMVHPDGRPFSCNICGQTFKNKQNLRRHVVGHSKPNWKPKPRANCKPKIYPGTAAAVAAAPSEKLSTEELDCDDSGSGNSSSSNLEHMEGNQGVND